MSHIYKVNLYNTSGVLQAVFTNFDNLDIEHNLRKPSNMRLDIDGADERIALFTTDAIIEVMRRDDDLGIPWYTEYVGFHRTSQYQLTEGQHDKFTSFSRSPLDLIRRRAILYFAGYAKAGPGDDVIKEIVLENAGAGATQPPRLYPGVTLGLDVAVATSAGEDWNGERSWRNLLDVITEIGEATNVYFDVVWNGGQNFTFHTYYPRLGTDRTKGSAAPAVFSPALANMEAPSYTKSRTEEANVIIVLGQGQESDRETLLVQSTADVDSPWNYIEETHDARQQDDAADLLSEGQETLKELEAKESFTFKAIQTPQLAYGKHYFMGDSVTAAFKNIERNVNITGIKIRVSAGREDIDVEFGEASA